MLSFKTFLIGICCVGNVVLGDFPFRNISLSWHERVDDLVSRLTLEEVVYQMAKGGTSVHGGPAPAIPRLGIKPYSWNTECLHGDATAGEATAFPQSIGLAASFWCVVQYKCMLYFSLFM